MLLTHKAKFVTHCHIHTQNSKGNYLQRKPKETHKVVGEKMRLSIKRKYV